MENTVLFFLLKMQIEVQNPHFKSYMGNLNFVQDVNFKYQDGFFHLMAVTTFFVNEMGTPDSEVPNFIFQDGECNMAALTSSYSFYAFLMAAFYYKVVVKVVIRLSDTNLLLEFCLNICRFQYGDHNLLLQIFWCQNDCF